MKFLIVLSFLLFPNICNAGNIEFRPRDGNMACFQDLKAFKEAFKNITFVLISKFSTKEKEDAGLTLIGIDHAAGDSMIILYKFNENDSVCIENVSYQAETIHKKIINSLPELK